MSTHDEQEEFRRYLADADELLRLPQRAAGVFAERAAISFRGLSELLDAVLPADVGAERRLARAVRLSSGTLRDLRERALDPFRVPQEALTTLARAMDLDQATFEALLVRDHAYFSPAAVGAVARSPGGAPAGGDASVFAGFREAWSRAELDDPTSLDGDVESRST